MNNILQDLIIKKHFNGELHGDDLRLFKLHLNNDQQFAEEYVKQLKNRINLKITDMNKEDQTQLIELYLDGELQGDELTNFEMKIQEDREFNNEYKLHVAIRETLTNKEVNEFRDKLVRIGMQSENKREPFRLKPAALYSFLLFVVIATVSSYFIFRTTYSNEEIFAQYYEHYTAGSVTRGLENGTDDVFQLALKKYNNAQYKEAIKLFRQISDTSKLFISCEFFNGISYMELKNYKEAIHCFKPVIKDANGFYYNDAVWYMGLCYIKSDEMNEAVKQFRILQKNESNYQKRAGEIIEKIK